MSQDELRRCADLCFECHRTCLETLNHCIQVGGEHVRPEHLSLMQDCMDICHTSGAFLTRGSERHRLTCGVCAEVCRQCADDCARLDGKEMQRCAETCRRCAESCRAMAG